eukprot:6188371-Pleurochrysis_carterae.AAC.8
MPRVSAVKAVRAVDSAAPSSPRGRNRTLSLSWCRQRVGAPACAAATGSAERGAGRCTWPRQPSSAASPMRRKCIRTSADLQPCSKRFL